MKNTMVVALVLIAGAAGYFVIHSHSASVAVSREGEQEVFLKHGAEIDAEDFLAAAREGRRKKQQPASSTPTTSTPAPDPSSFSDSFSTTATIVETNSASLSSSQRWWVNSGAYLYTGNANGKTVSGALPASDSWFKEYAATNPEDTDGGAHPQNIFRLVQKGLWQNFSQEVYYTISAINQSASTNRNASNGLFLFNRYQNGDNLYYVGLRVDGNAVIKKKYPEVIALRDVTRTMLYECQDKLGDDTFIKNMFVVEEIDRAQRAAERLQRKDMQGFGDLMFEAHWGLSQAYDVSCEELDFLVMLAEEDKHQVTGARMMGGGFGGCTINLVAAGQEEAFKEKVRQKYFATFKKEPEFYDVQLSQGVHVI
jgi:hypothetical protein